MYLCDNCVVNVVCTNVCDSMKVEIKSDCMNDLKFVPSSLPCCHSPISSQGVYGAIAFILCLQCGRVFTNRDIANCE